MSRYGGVSLYVRPEIEEHKRWLQQQGKAAGTIKEYCRQNRQLAEWLEARGSTLLKATPALLQEWRSRFVVGGNTLLAYAAAWRSFYKWAMWDGRITVDPTKDLQLPRRRRGHPRPIPEEHLLVALENAPTGVRTWLVLAAGAGLRACEIAGLRREDILDRAQTPVMIVRGKGDRERIVPLSPQVWAELRHHGLPPKGWIFRRADGQPGRNTAATVSERSNKYLHSIGVPETLHQLRHWFGTQAYATGRDLRVVQELMGHASPTTTAGYAAFADGAALETVLGVRLPLPSDGNRRELARDPSAVQIPRPPDVPVRPRVHQRKPPVLLSGRKFPVGRFELAVQHAGSDDHQVREARRVPARIVIVERAQAIAGYLTPYQPEEGSLIHRWLMTSRTSTAP